MATKIWAIFLVVLCTLLTSTGQVFWKFGSYHISSTIISWLNPPIILGFFSYGVAALILILALRHGELSVLYPVVATSYVWVALLSFFIFSEAVSLLKITALILIILGISSIGYGSQKVVSHD